MASDAVLNLIIDLKGADKAQSALGSLGSAAVGLGKVALFSGAAVAVGGFVALGAAITAGVGDARGAAIVFAQTEAVITSTGGAAGVTAEQVADYAASLSDAAGQSLFGDDQIQQSANLLLTFTNIKGGALEAATAMSVDMAQAMGGAPKDAAIQLGKALNDPIAGISALSRVGVTFSEEQKAVIATMVESGDVAGAQGVILAELSKEFGGSAAAAAEAAGGMVTFKANLGEIAESVGASLLPALDQMGAMLSSPAVLGAIQGAADALTAGLGAAMSWLSTTGFPLMQAGFNAIMGVITAAIPVMTAAWDTLTATFATVQAALAPVVSFISDNLGPVLAGLGAAIVTVVVPAIVSMAAAALAAIPGAIAWAAANVSAGIAIALAWAPIILLAVAIGVAVAALKYAWDENLGGIQEKTRAVFGWITDTVWPALVSAFNTVKDTVLPPLQAAFDAVFGAIKAAVETAINFITGTVWPPLETAFNFVKDTLLPGLLTAFQTAWTNISTAVNDAVNAIKTAWSEGLPAVAALLWSWVTDTVNTAGPKFLELAVKFYDWVTTTVLPAIGTALASLASALWEWISATADTAGTNLATLAGKFYEWVTTTALPALGTALGSLASALWEWITATAATAGSNLVTLAGAFAAWVVVAVAALPGQLVALASALWSWITDTATTAALNLVALAATFYTWVTTTVLPNLPTQLASLASALWAWITTAAATAVTNLAVLAAKFYEWVTVTVIPNLATGLVTVASALWSWITSAAATAATNLVALAAKFYDWITTTVLPALPEKLASIASALWSWITTAVTTAGTNLVALGTKFYDWVTTTVLPALPDKLASVATALWTWVTNTATTAVTNLAALGLKFVGWVEKDVIPALPGKLETIAAALWTFITTTAGTAVTKLADLAAKFVGWVASDVVPKLPGALDAIKTAITTWVAGAATWAKTQLTSIGNDIVAGLTAGITAKLQSAVDAVTGVATAVINAARGAFRAKSPSEEFTDIGKDVVTGLMLGIDQEGPNAKAKMKALSEEVVKLATDALLPLNAAHAVTAEGMKKLADAMDTTKTAAAGLGKEHGVTAEGVLKLQRAVLDTKPAVDELGKAHGVTAEGVLKLQRAVLDTTPAVEALGKAHGVTAEGVLKLQRAVLDTTPVIQAATDAVETATDAWPGYLAYVGDAKVKADDAKASLDKMAEALRNGEAATTTGQQPWPGYLAYVGDAKVKADAAKESIDKLTEAMKTGEGVTRTAMEAWPGYIAQLGAAKTASGTTKEATDKLAEAVKNSETTLNNVSVGTFVNKMGEVVNAADAARRAVEKLAEAMNAISLINPTANVTPDPGGGGFQPIPDPTAAVMAQIGVLETILGITSPSRLMAERIGRPMMEGIAMGFNDELHRASSSMGGDVRGVVQGIADGLSAIGGGSGLSRFVGAVKTIIDQIVAVAAQFSAEAIKAAEDFVDLANKVMTLLKNGVDAFERVAEFQGVPYAQIYALGFAIQEAVAMIAHVANNVASAGAAAAGQFATATNSVFTMLKNAADAFKAVADFQAVPYQQIYALGFAIQEAVAMIAHVASNVDAAGQAAAGQFATATNAVFTLLKNAADAFKGVADFKGVAYEQIYALGFAIQEAVAMIAHVAGQVSTTGAAAAGLFATATSSVFSLLKNAVEGLKGIADFQAVPTTQMHLLGGTIESAVAMLANIAGLISTTGAAAAGVFAAATNSVFTLLKNATEGLKGIGDFQEIPGRQMQAFSDAIALAVLLIEYVASHISEAGAAAAGRFSTAVGGVFTLLKTATEGLKGINDFQYIPGMQMQAFSDAIGLAVLLIAHVATHISTAGATAAGAFSTAVGGVFTLLKNATEGLKGINDFQSIPGTQMQSFSNAIDSAITMIAAVAARVGIDGATAAGAFSTATGGIFGTLKAAAEAFATISTFEGIPAAKMTSFGKAIDDTITLMVAITGRVSLSGITAARDFALAVGPVFTTLKTAAESFTAIATFKDIPKRQLYHFQLAWNHAILLIRALVNAATKYGIAATDDFVKQTKLMYDGLKNAADAIGAIASQKEVAPEGIALFRTRFDVAVKALAELGEDAARGVMAAQRFKRLGEAIRDQILAGVGAIMELDGITITANVTAAVAVKQAGQQASALSLAGLSGAVTGATPIPTTNVSNSVSIGNLTINQQPGEDAEALADRIIARLHQRQRLTAAAY